MKIRPFSSVNRRCRGRLAFVLLGLLGAVPFAWPAQSELEAAGHALQEERFQDAFDRLSVYLEEHPAEAEATFLLGAAERGLGRLDEAEKRFREAIALEDRANYHAALGTTLIEKGQTMNPMAAGPTYLAAMEAYRKALTLDNDTVEAHIGLCRYYWNAPAIAGGSVKKALLHAAEVERLLPRQGQIEFALIAQKEGRLDEAIKRFERALDMEPEDSWVGSQLGQLYKEVGRSDEARAVLKRALQGNPQDEAVRKALAELPGN